VVSRATLSNLRKGQYVILDNVGVHKSPLTKEIIEKAGCHLLYLPAYSTGPKSY